MENTNNDASDELTIKSNKLKLFVKDYFDNEISAVENALSTIQKLGDENNARYECHIRVLRSIIIAYYCFY